MKWLFPSLGLEHPGFFYHESIGCLHFESPGIYKLSNDNLKIGDSFDFPVGIKWMLEGFEKEASYGTPVTKAFLVITCDTELPPTRLSLFQYQEDNILSKSILVGCSLTRFPASIPSSSILDDNNYILINMIERQNGTTSFQQLKFSVTGMHIGALAQIIQGSEDHGVCSICWTACKKPSCKYCTTGWAFTDHGAFMLAIQSQTPMDTGPENTGQCLGAVTCVHNIQKSTFSGIDLTGNEGGVAVPKKYCP